MATFRDRNHLIAEANSGAPFSHFAWFHPNFYSAPKTSLNHLHSAQVNPDRGHPIAPIRYVPVETGPTKNIDLETKPSKARKQKPSKKSSNEEKDPNIVKVLKPRQPRKKSSGSKTAKATTMPAAKREKKDPNIVMAGINLDFSGMPSPVCSCTGVARVCYKWGVGGWQSSCCTINISEYPLPIKSSRPGSRMAGRKMSNGAYGKLIMRLAAEAYDLTHPVDLKDHWARHGTNKFVTIK